MYGNMYIYIYIYIIYIHKILPPSGKPYFLADSIFRGSARCFFFEAERHPRAFWIGPGWLITQLGSKTKFSKVDDISG